MVDLVTKEDLNTVKSRSVNDWVLHTGIPLAVVSDFANVRTVSENEVQFASGKTKHLVRIRNAFNGKLLNQVAFPPESEPVFVRESQPGAARKGFSEDEEDTTHD